VATVPDDLPLEIPPLLAAFAEGARAALGSRLLALWLFGSALSDDFAPASSDLDFLGVTAAPPTPAEVAGLEALHRRLAAEHVWGARLEGGYADRWHLRPWGIEGRIVAVGPDDGFRPDAPIDFSADNMAALRERSVTLVGPPATELVPEVDRAALEAGLRDYLAELLDRPADSATTGDLAAWTLNIARCVYGIQTGRTSTKREAAEWLARLGPEASGALEAALAIRAGGASADALSALRAGYPALVRVATDVLRRGQAGKAFSSWSS